MGRRKSQERMRPEELKVGELILTEVSHECGGWNYGIFSPEYDYYLHPLEGESPTDDEWRLFFSPYCSHDDDTWKIEGIKKYLRTEEHKKMLYDMDLSLEDILRGRYSGESESDVYKIFADWNEKLGFKAYGG